MKHKLIALVYFSDLRNSRFTVCWLPFVAAFLKTWRITWPGAVTVILLLLTYINPTKDDYATTMRQGFFEEATNPDADVINMLFGGWADSVIANVTTIRNFILFSTYQTEFGPYEASCIGALTTFLWCSEEGKEE